MLTTISSAIIPLIVLFIVIYGFIKKVHLYEVFIDGAKDSLSMILSLFPSLLGMILGINIFIRSGILNGFYKLINPLLDKINIPYQILPLAIMRPISGSTSLALLNDLLSTYGPDSFIGRLASTIQGSTDTTLYIITIYFGCIGIKKIKNALWLGLFADLVGIISSIVIIKIMFGY